MKITCTGRKVNLKDAFVERVEKRFGKLDKFFSDTAEAKVTVTVEKDWQTVEITVKDKGFTCRAEKDADSMEVAFDAAADVLERRIVKNRKKLGDRMTQGTMPPLVSDEPEEEYHVVREKHFPVKPCSVEEAILQMEMIGHTFYMFRNAETEDINVVYLRKNGDYGVIVPEE